MEVNSSSNNNEMGVQEEITVDLETEELQSFQLARRSLIGKIFAEKPLNKGVVRNILIKAWGENKDIQITDMGEVENPKVEGRLLRTFIRARALINVKNPLVTGCWVPRRDLPKVVSSLDGNVPKYSAKLSVPPAKSILAIAQDQGFWKHKGPQPKPPSPTNPNSHMGVFPADKANFSNFPTSGLFAIHPCFGPQGPSVTKIDLKNSKERAGLGPPYLDHLDIQPEFIGLSKDPIILDYPIPTKDKYEKRIRLLTEDSSITHNNLKLQSSLFDDSQKAEEVGLNLPHQTRAVGSKAFVDDIEEAKSWEVTFLYGNPTFNQRRHLWSRLQALQTCLNRPWVILGDFNEVLHHHEKHGLHPPHQRHIELFRLFVSDMGLMDLDLKGCRFTWPSNPRNGFITRERLDRVLVNWEWRTLYPNALALVVPAVSSDHTPIISCPKPRLRSGRKFKFELFWEEHQDYNGVNQEGWTDHAEDSSGWDSYLKKAKNCKSALQRWHDRTFRRANQQILKLNEELKHLLNVDTIEVGNNWEKIQDIRR
ncbi:Endonuclease/exonuclease/phosphatase superfamily [Sesbania bispinosa]|nr:Endonuclease/exonuclease/phosphatase superfamily [Sesbania bispinosa]